MFEAWQSLYLYESIFFHHVLRSPPLNLLLFCSAAVATRLTACGSFGNCNFKPRMHLAQLCGGGGLCLELASCQTDPTIFIDQPWSVRHGSIALTAQRRRQR